MGKGHAQEKGERLNMEGGRVLLLASRRKSSFLIHERGERGQKV